MHVYARKSEFMRVKCGGMPVKAGVFVQVRWYASETRVTKAEGAAWVRVSQCSKRPVRDG